MDVLPDYKHGIYNVPHTILRRLGISDTEHLPGFAGTTGKRVVLIIIDAMGRALYDELISDILPAHDTLTSVFPSTTAAAVTSIFTGLTPREHGILEWYMRFECTDSIIKTIPFTPADSETRDSLEQKCNAANLFEYPSVFSILARENIKSSAYLQKEYINSAYSRFMLKGAKPRGFSKETDLVNLIKSDRSDFAYIYIDTVDYLQHKHGPHSKEVREELLKLSKIILRIIRDLPDSEFFITADHGQTAIASHNKLSINENTCKIGGSPRDVFVYCSEVPENYRTLTKSEFIKLLGPEEKKPHPLLEYRAPENVILPEPETGLWPAQFDAKGLHGGLTAEEMLVPLIYFEN